MGQAGSDTGCASGTATPPAMRAPAPHIRSLPTEDGPHTHSHAQARTRALAHHETIAVGIPRPRRPLRLIIPLAKRAASHAGEGEGRGQGQLCAWVLGVRPNRACSSSGSPCKQPLRPAARCRCAHRQATKPPRQPNALLRQGGERGAAGRGAAVGTRLQASAKGGQVVSAGLHPPERPYVQVHLVCHPQHLSCAAAALAAHQRGVSLVHHLSGWVGVGGWVGGGGVKRREGEGEQGRGRHPPPTCQGRPTRPQCTHSACGGPCQACTSAPTSPAPWSPPPCGAPAGSRGAGAAPPGRAGLQSRHPC